LQQTRQYEVESLEFSLFLMVKTDDEITSLVILLIGRTLIEKQTTLVGTNLELDILEIFKHDLSHST
jgi:hypothetical protein